ncbi:hypothetical protein CKA32_006938 [Geitlerinema sp. FC II]|nr:hypothetical protein CKA32_006938 [Geitlerinema sp. FC II]
MKNSFCHKFKFYQIFWKELLRTEEIDTSEDISKDFLTMLK